MAATKRRKKTEHVATPEEVANDRSLAWYRYRPYEVLFSDTHQACMRFVRYERGKVRLATINGMADVGGLFPVLSVRRASLGDYR